MNYGIENCQLPSSIELCFFFSKSIVLLYVKVMLGEALDISRETYLAILMDRAYEGPVIVASPEGGVDIEEVAEKTPDKIYKVCYL